MIKELMLKFDYGWRMRGLWLVLHIISIYSAIMAPQYIGWALLFAVMATAVGGYAGWHRLWAHKSYKTDKIRKYFLLWLGMYGCTGKPITVLAGHRLHHKYSDEDKDIHSPKHHKWWQNALGMYSPMPMDKKIFKDLVMDPQVRFMQRYYFYLIFGTMLVLGIINPLLPGFIVGFTGVYMFWAGTFGIVHVAHIFGSKDHDTGDESRNQWLSAIITMGEGWHNNHHNNSLSYTTQEKWYQIDPTGLIIKYFLATDLKHDSVY